MFVSEECTGLKIGIRDESSMPFDAMADVNYISTIHLLQYALYFI
jgi:hypothetical protein